ncbi:hypothetical protein H6P81_005161 [Aristolochia fimbriata]|uniref:non-specific serine/threonine protein kinase n=1 Tax=Aristolochia fimbriata TaxID=158543 RepID=A0AAV7ETS8_ARIFI|nr:hypothetical protein H6P81_005161 [Aristolochia fimbriata]
MGISGHQNLPGVVETVNEIMKIMRSLPPRPTIDDVDAAMSVVKTADSEEQAKLDEISEQRKPPDVPDELFGILQEVRKNMVVLQAKEQRKEALYVIDLDKSLQAFDELIQRTSEVVSGDSQKEKDDGFGVSVISSGRKSYIADDSFLKKKKKEETQEADAPKGLPRSSSLKAFLSPDDNADKLSLIKVASVIENIVKTGADVLDLQGKLMDQIEWLPLSLGKLSDIIELNLSENRLVALPSNISSLKCLTKLDIHSNQLINLPEAIGELSSLVGLDLHANRLKSLPASIGNLINIVNLDLSSNELTVLPDAIGNLTKLKRLNVETNELEELPYTIGSWTSLIELRLDFNQLKALPEAVGKLENLETLTLHYNRVKGLPTTMGSLSKLKELDVSFNELQLVPENLCFATSLVKLNVGRNFADLRSLPRSIGNLEMLEELDISNNQIRVLPDSFRFLSKLRVFHADETPLEVPPKHVVKLGAQAVVEYMADLVKKDTSPVVAAKKKKKGFWSWTTIYFSEGRYSRHWSSPSVRSPSKPQKGKESTKEWVARRFYTHQPARAERNSTSSVPDHVKASAPIVNKGAFNTSARDHSDSDTDKARYLGKPAIFFRRSLVDSQAEKFKFCLVGKFPKWRPGLSKIRDWIASKWKLRGEWSISLLDHRHVFIRLDDESDMLQVWARNRWFIGGHPMRVFKWFPTFVPSNEEPSSAAVWVSLPYLPLAFYQEELLFPIASLAGKRLPSYCSNCRLQGHSTKGCRAERSDSENRTEKHKSSPKVVSHASRRRISPIVEDDKESIEDDKESRQSLLLGSAQTSPGTVKGKEIVESIAPECISDDPSREGLLSCAAPVEQLFPAENFDGMANGETDVSGKSVHLVTEDDDRKGLGRHSETENFRPRRSETLHSGCQTLSWKENEPKEVVPKDMMLSPLREYKFSEIKKMVKSFRDITGEGAFGVVYKGKLPDGQQVAVKVFKEGDNDIFNNDFFNNDFFNEMQMGSAICHGNIVRLMGFCCEGPNRVLVFEFMPNGSLRDLIHNKESKAARLGFKRRTSLLQIAIEIARGLEHLHLSCDPPILHLDLKPANVLLDAELRPKICDFGCARRWDFSDTITVRGTFGYAAPEYVAQGRASASSDVYSYGIVLLEMALRREPVDRYRSKGDTLLIDWVRRKVTPTGRIPGVELDETKRKMIVAGVWCARDDPSRRPSLGHVVDFLGGSVDEYVPRKILETRPQRWNNILWRKWLEFGKEKRGRSVRATITEERRNTE